MVINNNQKAPQRLTNIKLVSESGHTRVYSATTVEPMVNFNQRVGLLAEIANGQKTILTQGNYNQSWVTFL